MIMTSWDIRSTSFQIIYFLSAMSEMILFAGITFGWASIEIVFREEGFFSYLCRKNEASFNVTNSTTAKESGLNFVCKDQKNRFNLVFNVAVGFVCFCQTPAGFFNDKYGPRASQALGCLLFVVAGLGQAFVTKETSVLLFPIFIFFCCGGVFIAYAKFRVVRVIFIGSRSIVISILSGSFDASAAVLVVIKLVWDAGISLRDISLFHSAICLALVSLSGIFLTPSYNVLFEEAKRIEPTIPREEAEALEALPRNIVPETFLKSVFSAQFILELTHLSICQLRLWYFIGSLDWQIALQSSDSKESVKDYVTYFTYTQFFGLAVGPITGIIFDRNSVNCCRKDKEGAEPLIKSHTLTRIKRIRESILPFVITNLCCVSISLFALVPTTWALTLAFVFHVITRAFLYASHASFIAIAFRPEWFATLNSLGICMAGVFGFLEYPLHSVTQTHLNNNPFLINVILLVATLAAGVFPLYLWFICRSAMHALKSSSRILPPNCADDESTSIVTSGLLYNTQEIENTTV